MRIWTETEFILHNPVGLQNTSVFPDKLFLVRIRAVILQNLADTAIRETITCCIHVLCCMVDLVENSCEEVSRHMCYTTCVVSALLWIFFTQTVEGVKGELMRFHRP
jgi:hypothetical protein